MDYDCVNSGCTKNKVVLFKMVNKCVHILDLCFQGDLSNTYLLDLVHQFANPATST